MIVRHRSTLFPTPSSSAFDRNLDQVFEQLTSSFTSSVAAPRRRAPQVEALWRDDTLTLTVDLPGVPADAVSVEIAGRTLTLGAHTDELEWSRSLQLGTSLDPAKVSARHVDGRLTVMIGQIDAPEPRSIAIDTAPAPAPAPTAIEASESTPAETAAGQSTETISTD
jgi:HSP20 family protein